MKKNDLRKMIPDQTWNTESIIEWIMKFDSQEKGERNGN